MYRVFTHSGNVNDLDHNPDAGIKEVRYLSNLQVLSSEGALALSS